MTSWDNDRTMNTQRGDRTFTPPTPSLFLKMGQMLDMVCRCETEETVNYMAENLTLQNATEFAQGAAGCDYDKMEQSGLLCIGNLDSREEDKVLRKDDYADESTYYTEVDPIPAIIMKNENDTVCEELTLDGDLLAMERREMLEKMRASAGSGALADVSDSSAKKRMRIFVNPNAKKDGAETEGGQNRRKFPLLPPRIINAGSLLKKKSESASHHSGDKKKAASISSGSSNNKKVASVSSRSSRKKQSVDGTAPAGNLADAERSLEDNAAAAAATASSSPRTEQEALVCAAAAGAAAANVSEEETLPPPISDAREEQEDHNHDVVSTTEPSLTESEAAAVAERKRTHKSKKKEGSLRRFRTVLQPSLGSSSTTERKDGLSEKKEGSLRKLRTALFSPRRTKRSTRKEAETAAE